MSENIQRLSRKKINHLNSIKTISKSIRDYIANYINKKLSINSSEGFTRTFLAQKTYLIISLPKNEICFVFFHNAFSNIS